MEELIAANYHPDFPDFIPEKFESKGDSPMLGFSVLMNHCKNAINKSNIEKFPEASPERQLLDGLKHSIERYEIQKERGKK